MFCEGRLTFSTRWSLVLIWVMSFLKNSFFMWSTLDIDMFGYNTRGMIIGVITPCFTTFLSYLILGLCLRQHIGKNRRETDQESSEEKTKAAAAESLGSQCSR